MKLKFKKIFLLLIILIVILLLIIFNSCNLKFKQNDEPSVMNEIKNLPFIFIGGYARSGTTLIRAILGNKTE